MLKQKHPGLAQIGVIDITLNIRETVTWLLRKNPLCKRRAIRVPL